MQTEFPQVCITLGRKIAQYRKQAGLTQEMLAARVGTSLDLIQQAEAPGPTWDMPLNTLFQIAQVLGLPPSKLLEEDQTSPL